MKTTKPKCEVCGKMENSEFDITIKHRGCRLGQIFQRDRKAEKELGMEESGFMLLDITKLRKNK